MALRTVICRVCNEAFEASRSDAETCSDRCRNRLSRTRRAARERSFAAEVERVTALLRSLRVAADLTPDD